MTTDNFNFNFISIQTPLGVHEHTIYTYLQKYLLKGEYRKKNRK